MVSLRSTLNEVAVSGSLGSLSLDWVVDRYTDWVFDDTFMIMSKVHKKDYFVRDSVKKRKFVCSEPVGVDYFAVKCSKRGNDVYRSRVYKKFSGLSKFADMVFFNESDLSPVPKFTKALWVTLTYDTKLKSFAEAWRDLPSEFNRFMSFVRKRFGKVSCCRVYEAFENGYPHIHAVLLFDDSTFEVFPHYSNKKRKMVFACRSESVFQQGWHSWVDVEGMGSVGRAFRYQKKYLLKSIDVGASCKRNKFVKTLALCWIFLKRAFSVSGKFRSRLADLTKAMHNSNRKKVQVSLEGVPVDDCDCFIVGFVPVGCCPSLVGLWFKKLDAEDLKRVQEYLGDRWRDS